MTHYTFRVRVTESEVNSDVDKDDLRLRRHHVLGREDKATWPDGAVCVITRTTLDHLGDQSEQQLGGALSSASQGTYLNALRHFASIAPSVGANAPLLSTVFHTLSPPCASVTISRSPTSAGGSGGCERPTTHTLWNQPPLNLTILRRSPSPLPSFPSRSFHPEGALACPIPVAEDRNGCWGHWYTCTL